MQDDRPSRRASTCRWRHYALPVTIAKTIPLAAQTYVLPGEWGTWESFSTLALRKGEFNRL